MSDIKISVNDEGHTVFTIVDRRRSISVDGTISPTSRAAQVAAMELDNGDGTNFRTSTEASRKWEHVGETERNIVTAMVSLV